MRDLIIGMILGSCFYIPMGVLYLHLKFRTPPPFRWYGDDYEEV